jgi:hydroxymethylglutaryl-CoA lyase
MIQSLPKQVNIVEVGPRDGLQNEAVFVPTPIKIELINLLSKTGLKTIECGSFVSPKAIPQLADSELVFQTIDKYGDIDLPVLVPNLKGLERAVSVGVKSIALFASASESFSQKNINCSIAESLNRFEAVAQQAQDQNIKIRAYISCVLGCPYEGHIDNKFVAQLAHQLTELGADQISLGDTIGVGTPNQCIELINIVSQSVPLSNIAMHFHNTYGQAIANIYASLTCGITTFDSSVAGLGGCPYAKGATGNVATEDVLYLMKGLGVDTGVDILKLAHAGKFVCDQLNRRNQSLVSNALL